MARYLLVGGPLHGTWSEADDQRAGVEDYRAEPTPVRWYARPRSGGGGALLQAHLYPDCRDVSLDVELGLLLEALMLTIPELAIP